MAKKGEKRGQGNVGQEFQEKVLYINRCAKVVKGGRKFSFSALILVGDGKGKIGFGFAKANEVSDAIKKGSEAAKKNLISFETQDTTIPHDIEGTCAGARVLLKSAKGTGVVAGSYPRAILELAGIKDIIAKSLGSNNPINLVKATFFALKKLQNRNEVFKNRNLGA